MVNMRDPTKSQKFLRSLYEQTVGAHGRTYQGALEAYNVFGRALTGNDPVKFHQMFFRTEAGQLSGLERLAYDTEEFQKFKVAKGKASDEIAGGTDDIRGKPNAGIISAIADMSNQLIAHGQDSTEFLRLMFKMQQDAGKAIQPLIKAGEYWIPKIGKGIKGILDKLTVGVKLISQNSPPARPGELLGRAQRGLA
jgi:hypothetical protein